MCVYEGYQESKFQWAIKKKTRIYYKPSVLLSVEREKNQQDPTIGCLLSTSVSTCFGHHYAHLQENKTVCYCIRCTAWFYWMWLVAVVGHCVVGCEHCEVPVRLTVLTSYNAAPHNRYQPHPAEPEQYTILQ